MKTQMVIFFFSFVTLLGSTSSAARILNGQFDAGNKTVTLTVAFEAGCEAPEFYIDWKKCAVDSSSGKKYLFGLLLEKQDVPACGETFEQDIQFDISNIACDPEMVLVKSTSSKVPFVLNP